MKFKHKIGIVALGVPNRVLQRMMQLYMSEVRGTAHYHRSLHGVDFLDYTRLGGISSRCVKVAASYVWQCTKLVYVTTFDRRHELEDAIAVAMRVGRPFEVYLFRDRHFDLRELVQCEKRNP